MQNSYLRTFDNMFFNVEGHEEVKEIIEQASYVLDSIITKFGEVENEMTTGTSGVDVFVDRVIILFIRKIIEQLDAINVLYSICSFEVIQVILRSLFENIIALEFILMDDTKKRAAAYFFDHHYQELDMDCTDKSPLGKSFIKENGREEFDRYCKKLKEKRCALERQIKSDVIFQEIDAERKRKLEEKRKRSKKKVTIKWYETCSNVESLMGLMKKVGYQKYYKEIYGGLSFEVHGLNAAMGMMVNEKGVYLKLIRNPEGGKGVFEITCSIAVSVLKNIYQYLGDGENEKAEFEDFYLDYVKKREIVCHNLDMIRSNSML